MTNTANPFGNPVADDNGGSGSVDWDNLPDPYPSIPAGIYTVKVVDVQQSVSKVGNPMLVWTFAVSEGEHSGFEMRDYTVLTAGKSAKAHKYRKILGITGTGVSAAINKTARAQVIKEEYDGRMDSKIKELMPL